MKRHRMVDPAPKLNRPAENSFPETGKSTRKIRRGNCCEKMNFGRRKPTTL